jgi:indolepyruvate ferredoxin oxidoreductase alpha subunit
MTDTKQFLSGNEAIARGALAAGCTVATAYPGTPSSEILETLAASKDGIYCEWSVNEKVAMEVAIGASFAGARALCTMKHVGLNVASDPLMTLSYVGVNGGLVVVTADDPGMHSSQNEQDNRFYARFAKVPLLEPADSQEAFDMTVAAFEISERFDTPVIVRTTTRTSHSSGIVDLGAVGPAPRVERPYSKRVEKTVMVPMYARQRRLAVEERTERLREFAEICGFNRVEPGNGDLGFITSGISYQYVKEVFPEASVLKLGFTNPLPRAMIAEFAGSVKRLYVIEELDPFLEEQVRAMGITVEDHAVGLHIGELSPSRLGQLRAEILGQPAPIIVGRGGGEGLPARPPVLCAGCGHRGVFYVLNKLKVTVTGDIGCYTLAMLKPLEAMDSCICMGASIGDAHGFEKAGHRGRVAAVIGDSTFFHSGITGLLNIVYNRGTSTVIVLDNRTTAMTGHQDHPGTGRTLMGQATQEISIEQVARGVGVERVRTVQSYDLDEVERVLAEELDAPEPSVVVARQPCLISARAAIRRQFAVGAEACRACRACLRLGCPAIELGDPLPGKPKQRRVKINRVLCAGCGMCCQVCTHGAISEVVLETA